MTTRVRIVLVASVAVVALSTAASGADFTSGSNERSTALPAKYRFTGYAAPLYGEPAHAVDAVVPVGAVFAFAGAAIGGALLRAEKAVDLHAEPEAVPW